MDKIVQISEKGNSLQNFGYVNFQKRKFGSHKFEILVTQTFKKEKVQDNNLNPGGSG
jgi:hypothetical protein